MRTPSRRSRRCSDNGPPCVKNDGRAHRGAAYHVAMSPWYSMPRGEVAERGAAVAALRHSLAALRCAATLLVVGAGSDRDRGLGTAILQELNAAERALNRAVKPADPGPGSLN